MLGLLALELKDLGVPYEFMRWTSTPQYPYFVGEYSEAPSVTEDGCRDGTVMLTGTTTGSWLELENIRTKVESHFPAIYGLRKRTDCGSVAFFYANSLQVPSGEADLKRIQINLQIKEWRNAQ